MINSQQQWGADCVTWSAGGAVTRKPISERCEVMNGNWERH
jgi:hypothetical protein